MLKLQVVDDASRIHLKARNHIVSNQSTNMSISSKSKNLLLKMKFITKKKLLGLIFKYLLLKYEIILRLEEKTVERDFLKVSHCILHKTSFYSYIKHSCVFHLENIFTFYSNFNFRFYKRWFFIFIRSKKKKTYPCNLKT